MSCPTSLVIIALGYVGLPLAVEFGKMRKVIGFGVKPEPIAELRAGRDHTLEIEPEELKSATQLRFTDNADDLRAATIFVITVPTPIDALRRPDLTPPIRASKTVGRVLKPGDLAIYESTVYHGGTEEDCVPVLERESDLIFNCNFFRGYSPERINPGDKGRRLTSILKVTSGSTPETEQKADALYGCTVPAGMHMASSIRVPEAKNLNKNTCGYLKSVSVPGESDLRL